MIINCFKFLPKTKLDAAWGITGLFSLYAIRISCDVLARRYPSRSECRQSTRSICKVVDPSSAERLFFFISVFRNAFVIIVLTIASWLYCRHRVDSKGKYPIKILQTVPRGFQHVGPPVIDRDLIAAMAGELPVATIILLLEHIAISKCKSKLQI